MPPKRRIQDFFGPPKSDSGPSTSESNAGRSTESEKRAKTETTKLSERRDIKASWFTSFKWLEFNRKTNLFFCQLCLKAGKHNAFTMGKSAKVPKKDDFIKHEKTNDHKLAVMAKESTEKGEMAKAKAKANESVKEAVIATMKNVYYICKEDMAKDKMANLQEHVRMQGCSALDILSKDDKLSYTSHSSVDDFIDTIADVIEKNLLDKVRNAKFYALELDESTDIGVNQNLMIYIRAVVGGKVESHFLTVQRLDEGATAEKIYEAVLGILAKKNLSVDSLIALGTDGASVMTGVQNGFVTKFKRENPFILSQHCAAHRLALASAQAANAFPYMVKYQAILNDIYKYYHYSPKNTNRLQKAQEMLGGARMKFQQVFGTRWLSFKKSIDVVIKSFDSLISALKQDAETNKGTKGRPQGLLNNIAKYKFIATTYFMADFLTPLNILCLSLQQENLLFTEVDNQLEVCMAALSSLKTQNGTHLANFLSTLPENINELDTFQFKTHAISVSRKQLTEFDALKQNLIKMVQENLKDRFLDKNMREMNKNASVLHPCNLPDTEAELANYGHQEILYLGDAFGQDKENSEGVVVPALLDRDALDSEWLILKHLMFKYKNCSFQEFWGVVLTKFVQAYPNISVLATIFLTWPQTSVNVERGFSHQNLVKTDLRSSLKVQNLDRILMIKLEGPAISDVDWDEMFESWSMEKSRRILQPRITEKLCTK